jgi:hypothetical protein
VLGNESITKIRGKKEIGYEKIITAHTQKRERETYYISKKNKKRVIFRIFCCFVLAISKKEEKCCFYSAPCGDMLRTTLSKKETVMVAS